MGVFGLFAVGGALTQTLLGESQGLVDEMIGVLVISSVPLDGPACRRHLNMPRSLERLAVHRGNRPLQRRIVSSLLPEISHFSPHEQPGARLWSCDWQSDPSSTRTLLRLSSWPATAQCGNPAVTDFSQLQFLSG